MTIEPTVPCAVYTIASAGPFALRDSGGNPWPYTAGGVAVAVVKAGVLTALVENTDFTLSPASGADGNLTLSAGALAAHTGGQLIITRQTVVEQGWQGVQGAREVSLALQLDQFAMKLQEHDVGLSGAFQLAAGNLPPIVLTSGRALMYEDGKIVSGPTADEIANAQGYAEDAQAAAAQITPIAADITTVAGIADDVTTVAGIAADITTVTGQAAQIATVAGIDDDVAAVAAIVSEVSTVAGIAADVTKVAALYLGEHTTAPAPTIVGAWYLDTSVNPNVGRVWNGTAWITFGISSAATLLAGWALSGVETAHGSQVLLGAGGATPWNRAAGAVDYLNPLFWQSGVVTTGVTATIAGTGVTANKIPYVDYDLVGTLATGFSTFGYIQTASNTAGLNLQSWTGSVFMAVLGPAGGGAGAAQIGSGVRVLVESAGNTSGNAITGATPTLSTATRALIADGTVSLRTHIFGTVGAVINARVRVYGLQLELATARTNGQYRELLPSEARTLLDLCGVGSAAPLSGPFVDRSGIPAHANEVTVMLSGVTRTGAQMPLLQAMVAGAAVTTGYLATSSAAYGSTLATAAFTAGFGMNNSNASADVLGGEITLTRFAAGSNLWIASGQIYSVQGAPQAISVQGEISLAGPLSGLRFNGNGATLTAGSVALTWRV